MRIILKFITVLILVSVSNVSAELYIYPKPIADLDLSCKATEPNKPIEAWVEPPCPESRNYYVDLNQDGKCELVVEWMTGSRCLSISDFYTDVNDRASYASIESDFSLIKFASKRNGYFRLLSRGNVYYFDGSKYVCEFCKGNTSGGYRDLALESYKSGDYEKAEKLYWNAYQVDAEQFLSVANDLALTKIKLGKSPEAISLLEQHLMKVASRKKDIDNYMRSSNKIVASSFYNLSVAYNQTGDLEKSQYYRGLSEEFKDSREKPRKMLKRIFNK